MQNLWQELRFPARWLMKQPTFLLIAVLTLVLSTGFTQVKPTTIPFDKLSEMQPRNVKLEQVTFKGRKALRVTDAASANVADGIQLDFPATRLEPVAPPQGLLEALGTSTSYVGKNAFDYLVEVESERVLRSLAPDSARLKTFPVRGVIVTAKADESRFDFVSRFFAPAAGVNEDPVTGSAHCALAPYWSAKLQKLELVGYQASTRGGVVRVKVAGERVLMSGGACTVVRGELLA